MFFLFDMYTLSTDKDYPTLIFVRYPCAVHMISHDRS